MLSPKLQFASEFVDLYNDYFFNSTRGRRLLEIIGIDRPHLDIAAMFDRYFSDHTSDVSLDPNANVGSSKSPGNMNSEITKGLSKLLGYYKIWESVKDLKGKKRASELISWLWEGKLYFHDLSSAGVTAPYCFAASTLPILLEGRPYGQLKSGPPKRPDSFMVQSIEYTMDLSQEFMGAIALGDLFINYAFCCFRSGWNLGQKDVRKMVENDLQRYVHVINNKFRVSQQSAFVNLSLFDEPQLLELFKGYRFTGKDGSLYEIKNFLFAVKEVQRIYLEFMARKDPLSGLPYRFPISTVNLTIENGEVKDKEFLELVCKNNTEGIFNIYVTDDLGKIAACCRLLSDFKELMKLVGLDAFGNGGLNLGSSRVITVNLVRAAFESGGVKKELLKNLRRSLDATRDLHLAHRSLLKRLIDLGYLKFFKPLGWINLDQMFFCTIGLIGLNEALEVMGYELPSEEGEKLAKEILVLVEKRSKEFSQETRIPFNVEQIPAEGAAITLAKQDGVFFDNGKWPIYANQSVPLWKDVDLLERVRVDGFLNQFYTGGGISHLNINSPLTSQQVGKMIEFAVKSGLNHFALNPCFSRCSNGHASFGKLEVCGVCGDKQMEHVTRVVGYFTPVSDWVKARREEDFPNRRWYDLKEVGGG